MCHVRDTPTNDFERSREQQIQCNEAFCRGIGLAPEQVSASSMQSIHAPVHEKRKVEASSEPTREKSSRAKFPSISGNDELTQLKTMLQCEKCSGWNTGMQFPVEAQKALFTHQQSQLCNVQNEEKLYPAAFQSCVVVTSKRR